MTKPALHVSHLGEEAVLFQCDGPLMRETQARFWALEQHCHDLGMVQACVLGVHSLLLCLGPDATDDAVCDHVFRLWETLTPLEPSETVVEIPVRYNGEDLADLAHAAGRTPAEVVRIHTATEYIVFALGSQPGFPYLGGLDERLHCPRRASPRVRVEAGSVAIGGGQTGIISRTSPSGWHILGHTEIELFDENRKQPSLLSARDRVRFVALEGGA